ncbi:hypothetical protein NMY22_g1225 [Coprinellus aureogranulatus]|nr:hypothetical protein NMY22_g1225 [Coprinellus aureogranulatus]
MCCTNLKRQYEIPTVRRPGKTKAELEAEAIALVKKDTRMQRGPTSIRLFLCDKMIMVPRSTPRRSKWARSAFPFKYTYREKWSGVILKLDVLPACRTAAALGHVFLDLVEQIGGIPIQMTTDKGPEIGWQYAIQDGLRKLYAPQISVDEYPTFVTLKSTHNTVSEGTWRWLGDKTTRTLKETILQGKEDRNFRPQCAYHTFTPLLYWVLIPLVQRELDDFRDYWNNHKIRFQEQKLMPSAHVPQDAHDHPEVYQGLNCLIRIAKEGQKAVREYLSEQVRPREDHISWYTADFAKEAEKACKAVGPPDLSLETAWDVFDMMSRELVDTF